MYMIQIEESKVEKMSELAEKMLKYGGKLMQCIEEMSEESGMGMREGGYGNRGGQGGGSYGSRYGNRMGERGGGYGNRYGERGSMDYRDDDEWEDEMNERRGVRGSGRGRR